MFFAEELALRDLEAIRAREAQSRAWVARLTALGYRVEVAKVQGRFCAWALYGGRSVAYGEGRDGLEALLDMAGELGMDLGGEA